MPKPGDVVTVDFPGSQGIKRRPTIVVSTETYHGARPDIIVGILTSQVDKATAPTDYILQDWKSAGLHNPSAFRAFLATMPVSGIGTIGHLSERDWQEVQKRLAIAIAIK